MDVCSYLEAQRNQQGVREVIRKQAASLAEKLKSSPARVKYSLSQKLRLDRAYSKCGEFCTAGSTNFYLGTLLLTPERKKAIWALYAWGSIVDDIVDGSGAKSRSATCLNQALDQFERRVDGIFAGKPTDLLDEAVSDTVSKYALDESLLQEIMKGMRMDVTKSRYSNFDELYTYMYRVAGAFSLLILPIVGICQNSENDLESICQGAIDVGVATQLTNILRDVGEDAARGRIYLPQDELHAFGLSDDDVFASKITDNWREFTKWQVQRAREYYIPAKKVIPGLHKETRAPVRLAVSIYQQILDSIEANGYDNLTKKAEVPNWKKLAALPGALLGTGTI